MVDFRDNIIHYKINHYFLFSVYNIVVAEACMKQTDLLKKIDLRFQVL